MLLYANCHSDRVTLWYFFILYGGGKMLYFNCSMCLFAERPFLQGATPGLISCPWPIFRIIFLLRDWYKPDKTLFHTSAYFYQNVPPFISAATCWLVRVSSSSMKGLFNYPQSTSSSRSGESLFMVSGPLAACRSSLLSCSFPFDLSQTDNIDIHIFQFASEGNPQLP